MAARWRQVPPSDPGSSSSQSDRRPQPRSLRLASEHFRVLSSGGAGPRLRCGCRPGPATSDPAWLSVSLYSFSLRRTRMSRRSVAPALRLVVAPCQDS
jgi:hypothetical protein